MCAERVQVNWMGLLLFQLPYLTLPYLALPQVNWMGLLLFQLMMLTLPYLTLPQVNWMGLLLFQLMMLLVQVISLNMLSACFTAPRSPSPPTNSSAASSPSAPRHTVPTPYRTPRPTTHMLWPHTLCPVAMMNDTYDRVHANSVLEARREQAQLVLELESTWIKLSARLFPRRGWHHGAFPNW